MLLTKTEEAATQTRELLRIVLGNERVQSIVIGDDLEAGMDEALRVGGPPAAVVSTPFTPLPRELFHENGSSALNAAGFSELVEAHLTHHFRVARKVSLLDNVRFVLPGSVFAIAGFSALWDSQLSVEPDTT